MFRIWRGNSFCGREFASTRLPTFLLQWAREPHLQRNASPCLPTQLCRGYSVAREARVFKKLVTGTKHSRKKWFVGKSASAALKDLSFLMTRGEGPSSNGKEKPKHGRTLRRVGVLSTVFMEHITSLFATGEVSTEILGLGLDVTQIKISSDFTTINVYWHNSGQMEDAILEPMLKRVAAHLRHVLSQLRVIGQIPPIVFVKDTKYTRLLEVEAILSRIEFGEGHSPSPLGHNYKTTMAARTRAPPSTAHALSQHLTQQLHSFEERTHSADTHHDAATEAEEESGPCAAERETRMRQDMLSLDWDGIMGRLERDVRRMRQKEAMATAEETSSSCAPECGATAPHEDILAGVGGSKERQRDFLHFLKQRRILKAKEEKRQSASAKEREFWAEEKQSRCIEEDFHLEEPPDAEDYLEETHTSPTQPQPHASTPS